MANTLKNVQCHDYVSSCLADHIVDSESSVVPLVYQEAPLQSYFLNGLSVSDQRLQPASGPLILCSIGINAQNAGFYANLSREVV
jgi:hypothetical protein